MTAQTDRLDTALDGRHRILRHLGEGGIATVCLCEDLKHDRQVALKLLKPELAAVLGAERFVQEIKATAALRHPHILPLFDSGAADGFLFYVMPFIDGENAARQTRSGNATRRAAPPTYGTAFVSQGDRSDVLEPETQVRPVRWDNMPLFRRGIDSLPLQVARFRHGADSIELAVFTGIRAGALRSGLLTDSSVLKTGVFAVDGAGDVQTRLVDVVRTGERDTLALTSRAWRTTVPASVSYLRVEALEVDALRVARAIRDLTGFPTAGFGISDLVIGAGITAPANADAARWTDYRIAPIAGNALRVGRPVDLLWEVYAPAAREGNVRYRVSISVQREERSGLVGVAARLGARVRDAAVRSSGTDKIAVEYDRSASERSQRTESIASTWAARAPVATS